MKTDKDIYMGVIKVHIIFLPLRRVSGWRFCVFCGFAGGVLYVLFCCCFGCIVWGFFVVPYDRGFTHFCLLCEFSFLTSCSLLRRVSDGQERAVSEMEE